MTRPDVPDGGWDAAWEQALDELERTLDHTERLLLGADDLPAADAWTPPVIPAPLPAAMLDRAVALNARQQLLISRTVAAMSDSRRNAALVDRVADATGARRTDRPVYVDLRA
ncbi:MAG: hypothetical protein HOQ22_05895 [Nocardioidaceae bacterium]|nr:hypothetical protein [Nocardioidaceae bacterium]